MRAASEEQLGMNQIQAGSPERRTPLHVGKPQVTLLSPSDWVYAQLVALHLPAKCFLSPMRMSFLSSICSLLLTYYLHFLDS